MNTLDSALRANLRKLLLGFVEHAVVSPHLVARIEFPLYFHGSKFGAPVFSHSGSVDGSERSVFGVIGMNRPFSILPSEIVLQFLEILSQQPELVGPSVLRILPIADPVALELREDAPGIGNWDLLDHAVEVFRDQATGGCLEVETGQDGEFGFSGEAPPSLLRALDVVRATTAEADADRRNVFPSRVDLETLAVEKPWRLRLAVPPDWSDAARIHAVARFIARLFQAYQWQSIGSRTLFSA